MQASASSSVTLGSKERRISSATPAIVVAEEQASQAAAAVALSANTVSLFELRMTREPSGMELTTRSFVFTRSTCTETLLGLLFMVGISPTSLKNIRD